MSPETSGQQTDASGALRGARVLLAEDNAVNATVAAADLRAMGCIVATVPDGRNAFDRYAASHFDIVLMDCQMPLMDGPAAARAIRAHERQSGRRATPIVALSANDEAGNLRECFDSGMNAFLAKPYEPEALEELLSRLLVAPHRTIATRIEAKTPPHAHARMLRAYATHTPALLMRIAAASAIDDMQALERAAHSLKSSSANVGADQMVEMAKTLETAARCKNVEASATLCRSLQDAFSRFSSQRIIATPASRT
jgi:CheY-like chemotaxis protein